MNRPAQALIISADEDIRKRFSNMLNTIHASYLLESESSKALAIIRKMNLQVVILDLTSVSPEEIDFLHVVKKLRPGLPIIAITDDPSEEGRRTIIEKGAMCCIVKPCNVLETLDHINEILANRISVKNVQDRAQTKKKVRILAIGGGKGGVGKTVFTASLGVGLALMKIVLWSWMQIWEGQIYII